MNWVELLLVLFRMPVPSQGEIDEAIAEAAKSWGLS